MENEDSIYDDLQQKINLVINKLSENYDEEIQEQIKGTIGNLRKLNDKIQAEYDELKRLRESKRFTIAFYGETNAGKSTLIEALRLFFREKTIVEAQKKFKAYAEENGLTQEDFNKVRAIIMDSEKEITQVQAALQQIDLEYVDDIKAAEREIHHLRELLGQLKAQQNLWQRIMSWFSPPKEIKALAVAEQSLSHIQAEKEKAVVNYEQQIKSLHNKKQEAEHNHKILSARAKKLEQYADGQLIGDGRSDFTRENTSFDFSYNDKDFKLIDVPGIEGAEAEVSQQIEEAVKKAHAVFYVRRDPRPTQTGEGEKARQKGTLEKIKEHLGDQTEVWTIYNHSITNVRKLTNPLIGKGEEEGLRALDNQLKTALGDKYRDSLVLSAKPAYLSQSECIVPGSRKMEEKIHFLEKFSAEEILKLSGFSNFVEQLSSTIIGDYRQKIKKSNATKANNVLERGIEELSKTKQHFKEIQKQVESEVSNTQKTIRAQFDEFLFNLNNINHKLCRQFEQKFSESMRIEINNADLDKDALKALLERELEKRVEEVSQQLNKGIVQSTQNFQESLTKTVKRSNEYLNNIIQMQNHLSLEIGGFNFELPRDNSNLLGFALSGVGGVLAIIAVLSNPVGWTFGFIGGVAALLASGMGLLKNIRAIFDSSVKKNQQKILADKYIKRVREQLKDKVDETQYQIKAEMEKQIKVILDNLGISLRYIKSSLQVIQSAEQDLQKLSTKFKTDLLMK
ncbi:hypothetical protein [Pelistega ratti]|uniref:hypothetical protein n=1 Tax=Pelistega ratti TaxID=2652177 RepID=UPI001358A29B|nr:hypothetical protein [Pelistega ratti]